jgi:hypothetical protein
VSGRASNVSALTVIIRGSTSVLACRLQFSAQIGFRSGTNTRANHWATKGKETVRRRNAALIRATMSASTTRELIFLDEERGIFTCFLATQTPVLPSRDGTNAHGYEYVGGAIYEEILFVLHCCPLRETMRYFRDQLERFRGGHPAWNAEKVKPTQDPMRGEILRVICIAFLESLKEERTEAHGRMEAPIAWGYVPTSMKAKVTKPSLRSGGARWKLSTGCLPSLRRCR